MIDSPALPGSLPRRRAPRRGDDHAVGGARRRARQDLPGDLIILGVGGKIGPTLARLAKRAAPGKRVVGVARFSEKGLREKLAALRHRMHRGRSARPQADRGAAEARRTWCSWPAASSAPSGHEDLTWAMNAHVPALVAEAFAGSRIVAYSTGCVYPYVDVHHGGATEATPATPPPGAYANSCVAREAHVPVFLAHARHAGPHHPPQLRDRHALRRAARRRDARARRRADRSHDRATST